MTQARKGFTLLEIMVVIAIILILTAALSFSISTYMSKAQFVASAASAHVNKYDAAKNQVNALNAASPATTTTGATTEAPTSADPTTAASTAAIYTVTFVYYDGGSLTSTAQNVTSGGSATAPTVPDRAGYTFTGWDKTFGNITGPLTVTALYTANTYTVIFMNANGFTLETQLNVAHGTAATAPANPIILGCTFTGWDPAFADVTSNLTVTAKFTCQVTYDKNANGTVTGIPSPATINYGDTITLATPARKKYTFRSWNTSSNGNGTDYSGSMQVKTNVTLYAIWQ